jgi:hypothetical protein
LLPATARALWRQQDVGLTLTEYKTVVRLVSQKGEPLTYRAIYDTAHYEGFVAGSGAHGFNTNVRSIMKRIRKKFLAVDPAFSKIKNEGRVGYRWCESSSDRRGHLSMTTGFRRNIGMIGQSPLNQGGGRTGRPGRSYGPFRRHHGVSCETRRRAIILSSGRTNLA